jgi:hypothetical protein
MLRSQTGLGRLELLSFHLALSQLLLACLNFPLPAWQPLVMLSWQVQRSAEALNLALSVFCFGALSLPRWETQDVVSIAIPRPQVDQALKDIFEMSLLLAIGMTRVAQAADPTFTLTCDPQIPGRQQQLGVDLCKHFCSFAGQPAVA